MTSQLHGRTAKRHEDPETRPPSGTGTPDPVLLGAEEGGLAFAPVDLFSGRACPVDGEPMTLSHRDDRRRHWVCPGCGTQRR